MPSRIKWRWRDGRGRIGGQPLIALSMHAGSLSVMFQAGTLGYLPEEYAMEELVKALHTMMQCKISATTDEQTGYPHHGRTIQVCPTPRSDSPGSLTRSTGFRMRIPAFVKERFRDWASQNQRIPDCTRPGFRCKR